MSKNEDILVELLDQTLKLRFVPHKFQLSLAKNSCLGENNIITVRTGSGKTLIAALIARYWYEKYAKQDKLADFKVAFIVPTRNLVSQQIKVFEKAFASNELLEISENYNPQKIFCSFWLRKIIFLTPQKLFNTLNQTNLTLDSFTIIFFDECHHTNDKHPYNEIMKIYYSTVFHKTVKPLIVGLTASLGAGKGSPYDHLINMCANLDCKTVSNIIDHDDQVDLDTNIPSPLTDTIHFIDLNTEINSIKFNIQFICSQLGLKVKSKQLPKLGHSEFEQFIFDTNKVAAIEMNRDLLTVVEYLNELNLFYQRCEDFPLEYCIEKLKKFVKDSVVEEPTTIKSFCMSKINDFLIELEKKSNFINPKLSCLIKMILKYNKENSRGLVLVRTRHHTKALCEYLNKVNDLKENGISCGFLIGLGCVDGISMNENQQRESIENFKNGKFKVLVATDIAQEGLDVPTCNYVIRYEFVSNEIGTVQSRGRARAKHGQCILITTRGSLNEKRENENCIKEEMMEQALKIFNAIEKNQFLNEFNFKQAKLLSMIRSLSNNYNQIEKILMDSSRVDVHCRDCSQFLFNGSNLRYREPSYFSICKLFKDNMINVDISKQKFFCSVKSCGKELGRLVQIRNSSPLYMIDIKGITFKFPGNKMVPYSKWSGISSQISIQEFK
ncbi:unnamed protein product [Brachionus calyciflorus]|uniref:RNA helicase n=1 Tax=Brachionus calyciflorus TaxID=104777 RepID=A0A813MIL3_9BILA|nr:unnamed protein product [Brachionus calyciflorus]